MAEGVLVDWVEVHLTPEKNTKEILLHQVVRKDPIMLFQWNN